MAERSGTTGLLGVIIGAAIVIGLVIFFFGTGNDTSQTEVTITTPNGGEAGVSVESEGEGQ